MNVHVNVEERGREKRNNKTRKRNPIFVSRECDTWGFCLDVGLKPSMPAAHHRRQIRDGAATPSHIHARPTKSTDTRPHTNQRWLHPPPIGPIPPRHEVENVDIHAVHLT
jgi:hypothetical protein